MLGISWMFLLLFFCFFLHSSIFCISVISVPLQIVVVFFSLHVRLNSELLCHFSIADCVKYYIKLLLDLFCCATVVCYVFRTQQFAESTVRSICFQVFSGLAFMHEHGELITGPAPQD